VTREADAREPASTGVSSTVAASRDSVARTSRTSLARVADSLGGFLRFVRRAVLPEAPETWPSDEVLRQLALGRFAVAAALALVCLWAWWYVRGAPDMRPDVARLFFFLNVGGLTLNAAVTLAFLRRHTRAYPWILFGCHLSDLLATTVWVQLTGSTANYFLGFYWLVVFAYRMYATYRVAVASLGAALVMQWGVYALEERGLLPYGSLLRDASRLGGAGGTLREVAMFHSSLLTVVGFVAAGLLRTWLRDAADAVARVKRDLRRALDQARLGRLSGTTLGPYAVEELLGRGGMGEVYAARRARDGADLAIKLLHVHLGEAPEMRLRFRRESDVLAKMPPGTVAAIHEFGRSDDGDDYIVMERLRGEDLGALLRRRERLSADEVVAIVRRAARALDAAHDLGVVHRDLKPQNVFVCARPADDGGPDVRLLDFGVARLVGPGAPELTATAALLGTPGFMAPEQALGGQAGPAADVFALGAIAYRALAGRPAFPGRNAASALHEVVNEEPPALSRLDPSLPPDVDAVVGLALALRAAERYQRASAFAEDLALAVAGRLPEAVHRRAAERYLRGGGLLDTLTSPRAPG
jgi:predicted Ser/Thr protein kinase